MATLDNAHVLVVGIAHLQHINTLPPTVLKDAQDVYNLLIDPQLCGYLPAILCTVFSEIFEQLVLESATCGC
jgi:hypothetical protein